MKYNDIWRIIGFCALLLAGQNVLSGKERIAPGAQNTVSVMAGAPKCINIMTDGIHRK